MTDRNAAYIVVLKDDIREDCDQGIRNALGMVKGVISVQPVVASMDLMIAEARVKTEMAAKINRFLDDVLGNSS